MESDIQGTGEGVRRRSENLKSTGEQKERVDVTVSMMRVKALLTERDIKGTGGGVMREGRLEVA